VTAAYDRGEDVRVAVLGTGIMGSAMARNLATAGLNTTVWDRSRSATAPLAEAGVRVASSPGQAAADARVVITMLPTAGAVTAVIFGEGVAENFAAVDAGHGREDISAARLALGG
jgi:3-hydroxyisobutyrate dehydrogenase